MTSTQLQTLLVRTAVYPGESLPSLLTRLSILNDYDTPDVLLQVLQEGVGKQEALKDRAILPRRVEMYQRLAALTGINMPSLHAASAHLFAPLLTPPDNAIAFLEVSNSSSVPLLATSYAAKQLRPVGAGQFCPFCLRNTAYHRLTWMPTVVSACLEHCCLLIDRCQQCHKKVSIREIVETRCRKCKSNLEEFEAQLLNNDAGLPFQRIIQSWLVNDTPPNDVTLLLPKKQPRVLYRIIDGLQWATRMLAGTDWPYLHPINGNPEHPVLQQGKEQSTITPYESYCLYATAFKGMRNWPRGFYEFLQSYRSQFQPNKALNGGPKADFGNLYSQWLQDYWQHPAFEFVQKAFQRYFTNTYPLNSAVARTNVCLQNPNIAEHLPYINIAEAARFLGTTPRTIDTLVKTGRLTCQDSGPADKRTHRLVDRRELLTLRNKWTDEVSRAEAAKWLGLTEQMVIGLVKVGLLSVEHIPADGYPYWTFSKSALIECQEKVLKHVESCSSQVKSERGSFMNLSGASRQLFVVGLNAASILLCAAEGRLRAYCPAQPELRLDALLFDYFDIGRYIQSTKTQNGWIGRDEAAKHLGVKDRTLTRWVKCSVITPVATYGHVQYFDRKAIMAFITEHTTSEEAAKILGVGRLTVQKWARQGRLSMTLVSGPNVDGHHAYIFNKGKLTQWRNERLTFGEAAQLLEVSKATLHRLVKERKIIPLDDMGGKQRWFSKQGVIELCGKKI